MLELNKVLLTGRLTRDPEYQSTTTGRAVAKLSVAVNRRRYNKETGESQEEVAFIDVDTWDKSAEFCKKYLRKGSGIYIEGRIRQDKWQDKDTGANRSKLLVVAERVQFAETRAEAERHGPAGGSPADGSPTAGGPAGGGPVGGEGNAHAAEETAGREPQQESGGGGESTSDDLPF